MISDKEHVQKQQKQQKNQNLDYIHKESGRNKWGARTILNEHITPMTVLTLMGEGCNIPFLPQPINTDCKWNGTVSTSPNLLKFYEFHW